MKERMTRVVYLMRCCVVLARDDEWKTSFKNSVHAFEFPDTYYVIHFAVTLEMTSQLSWNEKHMQEKVNALPQEHKNVGLIINMNRTKVMCQLNKITIKNLKIESMEELYTWKHNTTRLRCTICGK